MAVLSDAEQLALERLFVFALGNLKQHKIVADFLLAWCDPAHYGCFDLQQSRTLKASVLEDMVTLYSLVSRSQSDPSTLGYGPQLANIAQKWRRNTSGGSTRKIA